MTISAWTGVEVSVASGALGASMVAGAFISSLNSRMALPFEAQRKIPREASGKSWQTPGPFASRGVLFWSGGKIPGKPVPTIHAGLRYCHPHHHSSQSFHHARLL